MYPKPPFIPFSKRFNFFALLFYNCLYILQDMSPLDINDDDDAISSGQPEKEESSPPQVYKKSSPPQVDNNKAGDIDDVSIVPQPQ